MKITQFSTVSLDFYEEVQDLGTGQASSSFSRMPGGGSVDDYGSQQTFAGEMSRGKNTLVIKRTQGNLTLELNRIKKLRGVRAKLRRIDDNGENQYQWGRLISADIKVSDDNSRLVLNKVQPIQLKFILDSDTWLGDFEGVFKLNDIYKLNDDNVLNGGVETAIFGVSPATIDIDIAQDTLESKINSRGPIFTITAPAGSSFSSVKIENKTNGGYVLYVGTVAAAESVIIDCGALRVLNDGDDDYDNLTVSYNTLSPFAWFTLFVGDNELEVTHNGADVIRVDYYEEHI